MTIGGKDGVQFGSFVLNRATSGLLRDGAPVPIEPQGLRLLEFLIAERDRVVSRDDLIAEIRDGRAVSDWAVAGRSRRYAWPWVIPTGKNGSCARCIRGDIASLRMWPVGPLPPGRACWCGCFMRPRGASEAGYLAEGLTEDLITSLARHSHLTILSCNTSRVLAGAPPPETLGVSHVIDGSLRQLDETIRINVAVLDGSGTSQIRAERFDLTRDSLLAGHDRISDRIAGVLSPGHGQALPMAFGTGNPEAYDAYLKGRYAYHRHEPMAFVRGTGAFAARDRA